MLKIPDERNARQKDGDGMSESELDGN